MRWTVSTELEFEQIMEQIDEELRRQGVPVHARQLRGWLMIAQRYELEGLRLAPVQRPAKPNVYSGDDLTGHILNWFQLRYGEQLNVDPSVGHAIVVIRGDAYRVRLPRIYGRARLVCDPAHHTEAYYPKMALAPNIATTNILDIIDGLQPGLSRVLRQDELVSILFTIKEYFEKFMRIEQIPEDTTDLRRSAVGDLRSSVDTILRVPPEFGVSRWHSLQAAEKFLKLGLKGRGVSYPRTGAKGHDLRLLSN
jgi:hypothetical protein